MITRALLYFSFLFIVACSLRMPPDFAACEANCIKKSQICHHSCRNNCAECSAFARQSTARQYAHYEWEQVVKGKIIALELNSFRDPLQCRKVTCDCKADYQICMQSCSGVVQKSLQHAPVCS